MEPDVQTRPKRVFVLGAGFTKAFLPEAPLIKFRLDESSIESLFGNLPYAKRILELEKLKDVEGRINIEQLMTRLDGRMPYDVDQRGSEEYQFLLSFVKKSFLDRIKAAKQSRPKEVELSSFARYCIDTHTTCITFNYDDVLDQALWEVQRFVFGPKYTVRPPYWHPDGGYGFFCRPSEGCMIDLLSYMGFIAMTLLKLHGSMNWRIKLGQHRPYPLESLVHHESWLESMSYPKPDLGEIEHYLEPEPFIVPPVLQKSALVEEPILRFVWSKAYKELNSATEVAFVGYSFPVTDIAAAFLFREAIPKGTKITVVNNVANGSERDLLEANYWSVFDKISEVRFEFKDASEWAMELSTNSSS